MSKTKFPDALRRQATAIQNHIVDEYVSGAIDRREFLRHASVWGMGPLLGAAALSVASGGARAGTPGGTIRVALTTPAGAIDPVTVADAAGATLLQQTGEFLVLDGPDLLLRPALATHWSANADATTWTFTLRRNVTFHSGKTFTADDVVATINRLSDPKNASNALSVFQGVLSTGNTRKVDDYTVAFHLDAPSGNFPYYVSSDNYNAIMLPAEFGGGYEKTFDGTGPFKLDAFTRNVSASFVRSKSYWGDKALPDRVEFTFYQDQQSQILAMQDAQVDVVAQFSVQGGQALLNNTRINIIALKSSAHNQLHMRCDLDPFRDKRVRRAIALTLNRTALVKGLFMGRSDVGNDSPFAPVFPSTDSSVAQRHDDLRQAKQLLEAAQVKPGSTVTLTTEQFIEIPDYAVLVQDWAKAVGFDIKLNVETQNGYYGDASFGKSDWLDSHMGITDYAHRGVPNVFLAAPLLSNGPWNAAHFRNPAYDKLVGQFVSAIDLKSQRYLAGKIETLLLDETPVIFGYFYNFLTATASNLKGVRSSATSQLFLQQAYFA